MVYHLYIFLLVCVGLGSQSDEGDVPVSEIYDGHQSIFIIYLGLID